MCWSQAKGPANASLSDHFFAKFRRGSVECKAAQRAFAESMAAYSLVCYFLQIKVGPSVIHMYYLSHAGMSFSFPYTHQGQRYPSLLSVAAKSNLGHSTLFPETHSKQRLQPFKK